MYQIGDVVVYGPEGLCEIEQITEKNFGGEIINYYVLKQIGEGSSVTYVPTENKKSLEKMRHILKREEVAEMLKGVTEEDLSWIEDDRERQKFFKDKMLYGNIEDLMKMTRMLYLHRKDQEKTGKKMHISDEHFFKDAEKMIVEEISYVMDMPEQNVIDYIVESIESK